MPLPSAGPHWVVDGTCFPPWLTLTATLTTYGLAASIENAFCACSPAPSSKSNCARQFPPVWFCDVIENGAAASFAATRRHAAPSVNGSGASGGACSAIISNGCFSLSRYFIRRQLL